MKQNFSEELSRLFADKGFRILETSALEQVAPSRSKKSTRFTFFVFFFIAKLDGKHQAFSPPFFFLFNSIVCLQYRYNKINRCSNYVTHARETKRERKRESINFTSFRYTRLYYIRELERDKWRRTDESTNEKSIDRDESIGREGRK